MEHLHTITDILRPIQVLRISTDPRDPNRDQRFLQLPRVNYESIRGHAHDDNTRPQHGHMHHARDDVTRILERALGHIPDLSMFCNSINLEHRCLFHAVRRAIDTGNDWNDDYFIYKCIEPTRMRLPKNQYSDLTNAYGDVFVFTLGRYRKFEHGWATYGPMRDFAESIDRVNAVGWSREEMLRDAVLEENRSRETMFGRDRVLREVVSADDVWEKDVGKNLMLLDWLEKLIRDVGA